MRRQEWYSNEDAFKKDMKILKQARRRKALVEALERIEREASCLDGLKGDVPLTRFAIRVRKMAADALAKIQHEGK